MLNANEVSNIKDGDKLIKKSEKLLKTIKLSKNLKLLEIRKSAKSGKKSLKIGN